MNLVRFPRGWRLKERQRRGEIGATVSIERDGQRGEGRGERGEERGEEKEERGMEAWRDGRLEGWRDGGMEGWKDGEVRGKVAGIGRCW